VAVATGVVSKETSTVSEAPNPLPETLTLEVGGPNEGVSLSWAAAGADEAPVGKAKAAATTSGSRDTRNRTGRIVPPLVFEAVREPLGEPYSPCA